MSLPPFQELLDRHAGEVHRFLVASVGRADADDCFQETFLSALRAYPRLRDGSNLRGWLFTIARRKALDEHRGRARRPAAIGAALEPATPPREDGEPALWAEVRRLPPKQRAAIVYRFACDLPYREIGRLVGCSDAAARQSVRAGLKRLREVWT